MKKSIFLGLFCMLSVFAKAQTSTVNLVNSRGCDVYFVLYGDNGCGGTTRTNLISVPAYSTISGVTPSSPTIISWTPFVPTDFNYVRAYQTNPAICPSATFVEVGDTGCSGKPVSLNLTGLNLSCMPCSNINAPVSWTMMPSGVSIIFHP